MFIVSWLLSYLFDPILFTYLYSFIAGNIVAVCIQHFGDRRIIRIGPLGLVVLLTIISALFFFIINSGLSHLAYLFLVISGALIIYCAIPAVLAEKNPPVNILSIGTLCGRLFTWLGIISYGVYIWHLPIMITTKHKIDIIIGALKANGVISSVNPTYYLCAHLGVTIILTLTLSYATFWLVEARFRPGLYDSKTSMIHSRFAKFMVTPRSACPPKAASRERADSL